MPVYVYKCPECGNIDTLRLKIKDFTRTQSCSKCGRVANLKISAPVIELKGAGWSKKWIGN